MSKVNVAKFSKIFQITFVLVIFVITGLALFLIVENVAVDIRRKALLNYLYSSLTPIIERFVNERDSSIGINEGAIGFKNCPALARALVIYEWSDERWKLVDSIGVGTLSEKFLTQLFPPGKFEEKFEQKNKILVCKENEKTINKLEEPYIIVAHTEKNEHYLAIAYLLPIPIRLSTAWLAQMRVRSFIFYIIFSLIASIIIVLFLRAQVSRQSYKIKHFVPTSNSSLPKLWSEFIPLIESYRELYSKLEEQKFEFERDAAIITAKSEVRLRSLALIKDIATIANSILEEETMLIQIMERVNRFFKTHSATIFTIREDKSVRTISVGPVPPEFKEEITKVFPTSKELVQRKVEEVGFVILDDISHLLGGTKLMEIAQGAGIVGFLRIPIKYKGEYSGAMHLYSQRVFPRDETTEKLLNAISGEISVALENKRLYESLENRLKESMALYEISKVMISATNYELLLEQLLWIIQESFGFAAVSVLLVDEEAGELYVKSAWGFNEDVMRTRIKLGTGITGWVATTNQPLIVADVSQDKRYIMGDPSIRSEMAVPLVVAGKVIGVLDVQSREINRFSERDLWFLSSLAALASLAIDRARAYEKLREQAIRDPLTGLYNRRFAESFIKNEAKEALLARKPVSIVMIDINSLKAVNDIYGHSAGDIILVDTGNFLVDSFPKGTVVRYGGDEFLVFLVGVDSVELDEMISEFRKKKNAWQIFMTRKNSYPVDFAVGSATAHEQGELEVVIDYADSLLYADKQGGML